MAFENLNMASSAPSNVLSRFTRSPQDSTISLTGEKTEEYDWHGTIGIVRSESNTKYPNERETHHLRIQRSDFPNFLSWREKYGATAAVALGKQPPEKNKKKSNVCTNSTDRALTLPAHT
ncbi:hypothetical protein COCC4DRAFT_32055 [Bipolaris maydis ATCC 48331]|uniref:Uncharacterized protein n=2 Tax=Cochliobolus heterostrophus TaxID=5016 RepID=M2UL40_COCH5|nr:uncharacterized protein COCC4DRAFT_32055 [Bipolaris maydis ATCC 48331]EMD88682.1 hypothetical protein COCHEDRAFT_1022972 [Bipolaris maydis C5]ENI05601.1 hypothetical protein COCC4DRAFT_32055 [Bipolaris maydis ATCC 48331]